MRDFNALSMNEKVRGSQRGDSYYNELNEYCNKVELHDLRYIGNLFI